ncbi:MAG TPA: type II secretion system F family protein [Anaerohalosphaeraceae bacterium]|nr:type II secretion system F family protein [Anaerohalosphaeraceae bacterium]HRT49179.1 type II secretion system F family protein [Anaerohalosphaeraceae bacterium]HRT85282.1 type II secretion system F family protein [Anaerohalosphaeraceae bacterium]
MSRQLAQAYHNIARLLDAGVPILRAMETASAQHGRIDRTIRQIGCDLRTGSTMAEAMRQHPRLFREFDVSVVAVGEVSGALPERFEQLGCWYDFIYRMRATLITGLIYPLLILHAGALLGPVPSVVLGGSGTVGYIRSVLAILALIYIPALAIFTFIKFRPRRGRIRRLTDAFILGIPIIGGAVQQLALSRFTQAFHIGCKAGVPYTRCMEMGLACTGNEALAALLAGGLESAKEGNDISEGFSKRLPADYRQIWQVGEESGNLDDVTARLARMTAESAEFRIAQLAQWLPRIVYLLIMIILACQVFRGYAHITGAYQNGLGGM